MTEIPMKMYWMGEDVETMPREKLIEAIRMLHHEVESTRSMLRATAGIFGFEPRSEIKP
jgi:hypothetical protein